MSARAAITFFASVIVILAACSTQKTVESGLELPPAEKAKTSCTQDADCICGGIDKASGDCFVGNRAYYATNVDKERQCPDFCTGIAANLETRCVSGMCKVVRAEKPAPTAECSQDSDCMVGGCSAQLCYPKSGGNIMTTCEWKEEYACYKLIACGCVQSKCAWKATEEFQQCLTRA